MPAALVTGATGLVGSHVVERLQRDGWQVRALVRDAARADWLRRRGVELAPGDTLDASTLSRATRGCDVVFHTAAAVTPDGGWEAFRRPNIDGTRNVVEATAAAGARLVHVSSVAVYGARARYAATGERTSEETPLAPLGEHSWYARSKRESEQLVLDAHAQGRLWATAVRPDVIYGERDRQFVPRVARLLRFGVAPVVGGGRSTLAVVHAANVADGMVRAATHDEAGGRAYNLANDFDVTVHEFFRLAGEGLGERLHFVSIPVSAARVVVRVAALATPVRLRTSLRQSVDFLTRDNPFSSERARRELGWDPPVRPAHGVVDAFRWFASSRRAR
ncbi:MAG TPA: NAD-dependent epimerase/dehydratase family protein [Gemmatimonadaceae bacterium]|nr:NAD-dependent epimerase/dehydratase family protein [Gemmatimonadaceae bacterium]